MAKGKPRAKAGAKTTAGARKKTAAKGKARKKTGAKGKARSRKSATVASEPEAAPQSSPAPVMLPDDDDPNRGAYLDAPPGDETRAVLNLGGVVGRERKRRLGVLIAAGLAVLVAGIVGLDLAGLIEIPGMGMMYDFTGLDDPNSERAASRTQPKSIESDLSDAEKKRMRDKLLGLGRKPASPSTRRDANKLSAADREMTANIFADNRKSERKVSLKPPKKIHAPNLPSGLTSEAIYNVVAENSSAMSLCIARSMKVGESLRGKMEVEISIASNGRVEAARILTASFAASVMGECALKAVRRWRFPTFSGEPVLVSFPYVLSTGP